MDKLAGVCFKIVLYENIHSTNKRDIISTQFKLNQGRLSFSFYLNCDFC
jgi:hypothetical protein